MVENGYRVMKCPQCGFKADRDTIAVLNIEKKASSKYGGISDHPDCPADDRCKPE
jgi:transposase